MSDLSFYKLGSNPELEALRTKQLYADSGVDEAVRNEFEATVVAYQTLPVSDIAERIRAKYTGHEPAAFGVLAVINEVDVGMAIWGRKDFYKHGEMELVEGINVSGWILRQYRNIGFGGQLIRYVTNQACAETIDSYHGSNYGRRIWTSIKPENTASISACKNAGFVETVIQPDNTDRLLYILDAE